MQQPCSSHAHAHAGGCWQLLLTARCCWLLLAAGLLLADGCCWLLLLLLRRLVESLKNF
jgi:hypothetical protein